MQAIINNPYRIAGILANSSDRDILKQKNKIKRFTDVGREVISEYDFPFFPSLQRNNTIVNKAFSDIEQNQDKVTHSLFWFLSINNIDKIAIRYLSYGNKEKSFEIWGKLIEGKKVDNKNYSAFNNMGTLCLLDSSKEIQKQGINLKIKLIESENFRYFINNVADEIYTVDNVIQIKVFIDKLLTQLKNNYSTAEIVALFKDCNDISQKYISQKFTEEPIHNHY